MTGTIWIISAFLCSYSSSPFYCATVQCRAVASCSSRFETCDVERGCQPFTQSPTWRTSPPYLWLPETRWSIYTARHWVARYLGSPRSRINNKWALSVHIIPVNHLHSRHNKPLSTPHNTLWLFSACHKFVVRCHTNTDLVQRSALLICLFEAHQPLTAFIWLVGHLSPSSTRLNLPAKECRQ